MGRADLAYRMLENEKQPGWLYEVKQGATTIWENWEGSASHNHYSPGAVCQWLFDTVAGIVPDGENHFVIRPVPGGDMTWAGLLRQPLRQGGEQLAPGGRSGWNRWDRKDFLPYCDPVQRDGGGVSAGSSAGAPDSGRVHIVE